MFGRIVVTLITAVAAITLMAADAGAEKGKPTYSKDVAPILNDSCVVCHREGEIGPMSLQSYQEVRPWAKSILNAVSDRKMPPWHADKGFGPFKNERTLTDAEIDIIVTWASSGAIQGDKKDLPPPLVFESAEWRLGEPDLIVKFQEVEVPGGGPDRFHNLIGETGLDEDKWLRAVDIKPGSRKVVHHVIIWQGGTNNSEGWIGGWAAGALPMAFPEGTGRLLKAGNPIIGDMHYHPIDTAEKDRTSVGLYFADEGTIEKEMINLWVMDADFEIPPGAPNHEVLSSFTFPQDSHIRALAPHMHYRGKDFAYALTYPDGSRKELLKVSKYDFNWQTNYEYAEAVAVPAGTRIDCVAHFDNSVDNEANPDPTKAIRFGPESYDEMMIGFVDYTVDEGIRPSVAESPVIAKMKELAAEHPGEVYKVMIAQGPTPALEPSALHLPRSGDGGWYVAMASIVGKAPVVDIRWDGNAFTATAKVPGQDPMPISGTVENGKMTLTLPAGPGLTANIVGELVE